MSPTFLNVHELVSRCKKLTKQCHVCYVRVVPRAQYCELTVNLTRPFVKGENGH